ncbi:hypothetical protein M1N44_01480 [Dehalococcoidia bacterium]|nr:hypothetical protein [Dehalococcoidia bacterium]
MRLQSAGANRTKRFRTLANPGSKGYNTFEMKKRVAGLILLITVAIVVGYLAVVGWLTGFLIAKYGGGKQEGMRGRVRSVMVPLGRYSLHLHHWLICSALMVLAIVRSFYLFVPPEIFLGFLGGLAFQGVYCYSDWRRIIHRRHS